MPHHRHLRIIQSKQKNSNWLISDATILFLLFCIICINITTISFTQCTSSVSTTFTTRQKLYVLTWTRTSSWNVEKSKRLTTENSRPSKLFWEMFFSPRDIPTPSPMTTCPIKCGTRSKLLQAQYLVRLQLKPYLRLFIITVTTQHQMLVVF